MFSNLKVNCYGFATGCRKLHFFSVGWRKKLWNTELCNTNCSCIMLTFARSNIFIRRRPTSPLYDNDVDQTFSPIIERGVQRNVSSVWREIVVGSLWLHHVLCHFTLGRWGSTGNKIVSALLLSRVPTIGVASGGQRGHASPYFQKI